jgi:hypothetical protein
MQKVRRPSHVIFDEHGQREMEKRIKQSRNSTARSFAAQQTDAAIGVAILNQMLGIARPQSVRCKYAAPATA